MAKSTAPSISLFFPAWNEEDYVERAVTRAIAVLSKLTDDFEVIVVNDASTDRTREICEGLEQAPQAGPPGDTTRSNLKLGGAMRTGFSESTKDIVCYSDIDLPVRPRGARRARST